MNILSEGQGEDTYRTRQAGVGSAADSVDCGV